MGERMKPRQLLRVRAHPVLVTPTPAPQGPQNGPFSRLFVTEGTWAPSAGPLRPTGSKRLVQVLPWCWVKLNPRFAGAGVGVTTRYTLPEPREALTFVTPRGAHSPPLPASGDAVTR